MYRSGPASRHSDRVRLRPSRLLCSRLRCQFTALPNQPVAVESSNQHGGHAPLQPTSQRATFKVLSSSYTKQNVKDSCQRFLVLEPSISLLRSFFEYFTVIGVSVKSLKRIGA